ncbi:cytochrome c oxidase subunit 2A [Bacillus sp. A301a_S52]|nr:cytochrome c oxidase subunit 2A [Bacillus sp. A301a_S52]
MGQAGLEKDKKTLPATEQETSLKGTLIFVLSIGSFILITWFAIFYLFVGRI